MAKKDNTGLLWLLLLLGAAAYGIQWAAVRFLDPDTGAATELPTAEAAIGRYAAGRGMTAEEFLRWAEAEAAAAGMPLWQYLNAVVPGMP